MTTATSILIIVALAVAGYYILKNFLLRKNGIRGSEESRQRRRGRYEEKLRRREYSNFHNERIRAEENAAQRNFLANPQPFNLIGDNSHAKRFADNLRGI